MKCCGYEGGDVGVVGNWDVGFDGGLCVVSFEDGVYVYLLVYFDFEVMLFWDGGEPVGESAAEEME